MSWRPLKTSLGIRAQLIIGIVITTMAGIGLIGVMSLSLIEGRALQWKTDEAHRAAGFMKAAFSGKAAGALQSQPGQGFITDAAMKGLGIKDYVLKDGSGSIILRAGELPKEEGELVSISDGVRIRRLGNGFLGGPGRLLVVEAYLDGVGPAGGSFDFTLLLADVSEDTGGIRRLLLLYAAIDAGIIILFGVFFLSKSIIRPVKALEEAARRIAGGALSERAVVDADNEVGRLAESFNTMAERLSGEIKALERLNKELMAAQEELLRSSTLAAVGRLAAGIAHEIGNPLGAVRGYIDILSKPGIAPDDEAEILKRAGKEASRMDSIVRGFLDISRSPREPAAPVDVNVLVEEAVSTVTVLKDFDGVEVIRSLGKDIPKVIIDDGKLRQVIMNILINAAQAMKGVAGNKLVTVETVVESHPVDSSQRRRRRKDDQPALFSDSVHEEKEFVAVKVTDTGAGISEDDSKKIFEPFFTTKEAGSGTGLGLFVSSSIIKAYGGDIIFRTKAGQGSCFSIILPSWRGE